MRAKIRLFIRRVKRSIRTDRTMWIRGIILAVILLVIVVFVGNCACKKKEKPVDEASQGVMQISPAPSPTPTEVPRQVSADAAATNGNVTMINEYLVQKKQGSASGTVQTAPAEEAASGDETADTEMNTESGDVDSGEQSEE